MRGDKIKFLLICREENQVKLSMGKELEKKVSGEGKPKKECQGNIEVGGEGIKTIYVEQ